MITKSEFLFEYDPSNIDHRWIAPTVVSDCGKQYSAYSFCSIQGIWSWRFELLNEGENNNG